MTDIIEQYVDILLENGVVDVPTGSWREKETIWMDAILINAPVFSRITEKDPEGDLALKDVIPLLSPADYDTVRETLYFFLSRYEGRMEEHERWEETKEIFLY